jgi:hypothetical protein
MTGVLAAEREVGGLIQCFMSVGRWSNARSNGSIEVVKRAFNWTSRERLLKSTEVAGYSNPA